MAGVKAPSKTKDKKKQGKNNLDGVNEEQLVLTPSEKELGIRITQPKQKTIDTMIRLYAVPSEKLRVWTCWLTKVGERADDWQWWLRAQIGLALRISDHLQQAILALEVEKGTKLGQGDEKASDTVMVTEESETKETATEVSDADSSQAEPTIPEQEVPATKDEVPKELENTAVPEGEPGDIEQPVDVSEKGRSEKEEEEEKGDKNEVKKNKGKKTKAGKLEPKIVYKEGFWPIGVRWKPMSLRGNRKPPPQREPDEIPIPTSEEEMTELIRKFKHQGVIYRSLYKHWSKTADQALKQIMGRNVLPTKEVYFNGEEVPYFFYLESEPDMEYVIEYDDEEVLVPDRSREKITHEFTHLYFNLSDKPGKGGKPWI